MSELNERQWAVYNLLKNNPDKYLKQIDICLNLRHFYSAYASSSKPFHDSNARQLLTKDIRAINESGVIQKIIISNSKGVKIANEAEFEAYIKSEFAACFRKLQRIRQKARKAGLNGQMRFTFGGGERDTTEAFADNINRLKAARLKAGLKLADVVARLAKTEKGIDISLLSKMEHGYCKPTESLLIKLSEIYGCEPFSLIDNKVIGFDIIA